MMYMFVLSGLSVGLIIDQDHAKADQDERDEKV